MTKPLQLAELLGKSFPAENVVIGSGILNQGSLLVLGGPPKTGKSFILKSMCYHLATGTPLFGVTRKDSNGKAVPAFEIPHRQKILLLEQEIGFQDLQLRFKTMLERVGPAERRACEENIYIHSCDHTMQLDSVAGVSFIASLVREVRPDVVAFDPLVEFHTVDENSAQDMARVLHGLDMLREKHGFSTLLTHHVTKPTQDSGREGPDNLRGSSVLFGKGDSFLMVKPNKVSPGKLNMTFTLRRGKPIPGIALEVDSTSLQTRFLGWSAGQKS